MGLLKTTNTVAGSGDNNPFTQLSKSISDTITGLGSTAINPLKAVDASTTSGVALVSEGDSMLTKALTTYKSINIDKIISGASDLVGGILNNPDLGRIMTYEDGFKVDTSELLRIASQGLGFNVGSMTDIKGQMGQSFLDELDQMTGGLSNGLFFSNGDGKLVIADGWQMSVGESLIGFIGRNNEAFSGIVNIAGVNSVLNVMIRQAAQNAMYQSYESFGDQYLFESDYHNAIINSMEYCIGRGDIQSINKMFEIIGKDGIHKVRAQYPDLIERTLVGFYFTENTYEEDYAQLGVLLNNLLVTVGGDNWHLMQTEYGAVYNLAMVSSISENAALLLSAYPQYIPMLAASSMFGDENALDVFQVQFPKAVRIEN